MKRFFSISAALICALCLLAGCATTQDLTSSITSKVGSITSNVDDELFSQVPESERHKIPKAESELRIADEKLKLAILKEELADAHKELFEYQANLAEKQHKAASLNLDIAKNKAIDRAGLGDKDKNIKNIAKLKTKKHDIEGNRINIEAKISIAERKIVDLTEQVKQQEDIVANLPTAGEEPQEQAAEPPIGKDETPAEKVTNPTDIGAEEPAVDTTAEDGEPAEETQDQ